MAEITLHDVNVFLDNFKVKASVFGIKFRNDRTKNIDTLFRLGISAKIRERIVLSLEDVDYCDGPILDSLNKGADMWVFGKDYDGHELYIKISLGDAGDNTVCISFHEAEFTLHYPFKPK